MYIAEHFFPVLFFKSTYSWCFSLSLRGKEITCLEIVRKTFRPFPTYPNQKHDGNFIKKTLPGKLYKVNTIPLKVVQEMVSLPRFDWLKSMRPLYLRINISHHWIQTISSFPSHSTPLRSNKIELASLSAWTCHLSVYWWIFQPGAIWPTSWTPRERQPKQRKHTEQRWGTGATWPTFIITCE